MFCLRTLSSRPLRKNAQWRPVEHAGHRCVTNVEVWRRNLLISFVVLHRVHESAILLTHKAVDYHARGLVQVQHYAGKKPVPAPSRYPVRDDPLLIRALTNMPPLRVLPERAAAIQAEAKMSADAKRS